MMNTRYRPVSPTMMEQLTAIIALPNLNSREQNSAQRAGNVSNPTFHLSEGVACPQTTLQTTQPTILYDAEENTL
jgi:hypothetical protein